MTEKEAETLALQGDPKRQAVSALHGYLYQIWHSVHAWLDLKEEAFLFLEGAEDFDIVDPEQATVVQVKATSANITLNSTSVTEAIRHYWQLQKNHPEKRIFFRFLTRSGIGIEKGQPFGAGVAGLELWQHCLREPETVAKLRDFLLTLGTEALPVDLQTFLSGADTQQILERLILPLAWETESADIGYVEQAIERKLILHGDKYGIPPEKSASVVSRLLKEALTTVCRKDQGQRFLDRALFLRLFEEETTSRVPAHQLQALTNAAATVMKAFLGGPTGLPFQDAPLIQTVLPPLQVHLAPRDQLVDELKAQLDTSGILVLTGSAGMGKTTLAKLVARSAGGDWCWLNVSNRDRVQLSEILRQLSLFMEQERAIVSVIIDDIDLSPAPARMCEDYLGGLLYTLLERNGRIIITSQKDFPQRLIRHLGLEAQSLRHVPRLDESEIAQFALLLGCPEEKLALNWAKVIFAHTSGHPQLAHARLISLSESHWPALTAHDVLKTPSEVALERTEARKLLVEQLPEFQRELLYPLSVVIGFFRRDHAVAIGDTPPSVTYPGDAFDRLVGPWIEPVTSEYYSLSPLLGRAADDVWPKEKVQTLHTTIAATLLRCGRLSTVEARAVFFHAWVGRSAETLAVATMALLSAPEQVWTRVTHDLSWFTLVGLNPPCAIFAENAHVNFLLRLLQFRIAVKVDPIAASSIIEAWNNETTPHEPRQAFLAERLMLAAEVLIRYHIEVSAKNLLAFLVEIAQIQKEFTEASQILPIFTPSQFGLEGQDTVDVLSVFFLFVAARCFTVEFLDSLLEGLKETPQTVRSRLLAAFQVMEPEARMLIDQVWWREAEHKEPNWPSCIAVFEKAVSLALEWQAPAFAAAAARGIAIIHDEYLKDSPGALAVLDRITMSLEGPSLLIEDRRATILFGQGQYAESLALWENLFPQWSPTPEHRDFVRVFASRHAGIAAAQIGEWNKASRFFFEGYQHSQALRHQTLSTGFLADVGFALWKAQRDAEAVKTFMEALQQLQELPDPDADLASFVLRKRIGHTLLWLERSLRKDIPITDLLEPPPGVCSDPEHSDKFRELPDTPIDLSWLHLLQIEYHLGTGSLVFDMIRDQLLHSSIPAVCFSAALLDIRHSLRCLTFDRLPTQVRDLATTFQFVSTYQAQGNVPWEDSAKQITQDNQSVTAAAVGPEIFIAALVAMTGTDQWNSALFDRWRENAKSMTDSDSIVERINVIESILLRTGQEAIVIMSNKNESWEKRMAAALKVADEEETATVNELLYAHVSLASGLLGDAWSQEVAPHLTELFARQWGQRTQLPAAFRAPRLTVPEIQAACKSTETPTRKAIQILLAVSNAVSVPMSEEVRNHLRRVAGDPT